MITISNNFTLTEEIEKTVSEFLWNMELETNARIRVRHGTKVALFLKAFTIPSEITRNYIAELHRNKSIYLIKSEQTIVGVLILTLRDGEQKSANVDKIYIHQDHRRKGYAREALLALEHLLAMDQRIITLTVDYHNPIARDLYESMGFKPMSIKMYK